MDTIFKRHDFRDPTRKIVSLVVSLIVSPIVSLGGTRPCPSTGTRSSRERFGGDDWGTRSRDTVVSPIVSLKCPQNVSLGGHDRVQNWGTRLGDTIRDTIFRVVSLIVSLRTGDTIFLKIVSLSFLQGHDWGTRHDRVPDKSTPDSNI